MSWRAQSTTERYHVREAIVIRPRGTPIAFRAMAAVPDPSDSAPPVTPAPAPRSLARAIVKTARPKQWTKNVLVFAAPLAAGVLDDGDALAKTLVAFVAFCLAASGAYFLNDASDAAADRLHPTKRHRPVAAGELSVNMARGIAVALIAAALLI